MKEQVYRRFYERDARDWLKHLPQSCFCQAGHCSWICTAFLVFNSPQLTVAIVTGWEELKTENDIQENRGFVGWRTANFLRHPKTPWNISQRSLDGMPSRTALVMTACAEQTPLRYKQGRADWESTTEIPFAFFFAIRSKHGSSSNPDSQVHLAVSFQHNEDEHSIYHNMLLWTLKTFSHLIIFDKVRTSVAFRFDIESSSNLYIFVAYRLLRISK